MARRYDSQTTIFSPEGRLHQTEYAMEAICRSGAAVAIRTNDGIVIAGIKLATHPLLEVTHEKIFKINSRTVCAVAGITSDSSTLIEYARDISLEHSMVFDEEMPIENLVLEVCDLKQSFTQFGGLRPFGVSLLFAGWDDHFGFQLYQTVPSGSYGGWKGTAIGEKSEDIINYLKKGWKDIEEGQRKWIPVEPEIHDLQTDSDLQSDNTSSSMAVDSTSVSSQSAQIVSSNYASSSISQSKHVITKSLEWAVLVVLKSLIGSDCVDSFEDLNEKIEIMIITKDEAKRKDENICMDYVSNAELQEIMNNYKNWLTTREHFEVEEDE
ncbi:putative proteasome subunit alpha type 4, subunit [Monocercomonoides exilis]|uniref:putative proteasome subunit alpha type 4, subunit n=1 Tax=Monocercomonoides exilis TaxID=2049356 RepID=UPI003559F28E|nr:putative proteasome subunit alpha type 4, subunit [Monocercomonoides exilis]|eukprot:MONOS_2173.1-p1 / transcript=MONOS_2173.1 / gene=MONOS_2173 / organism=Monocercomonoides_exilis_PA203 / gene_product=putative proteasome subunit alpha type 4, subunit / transcript_product=putative proteasome subunit alpha type 4, subunit / location=Mono_scaffold00043:56237-57402(-) / protein_length=324 / sequence_SO=supercontig / SO=protein_coding / is_pseudo=false